MYMYMHMLLQFAHNLYYTLNLLCCWIQFTKKTFKLLQIRPTGVAAVTLYGIWIMAESLNGVQLSTVNI